MINGIGFGVIGAVMLFAVLMLSHISSSAPLTIAIQVICGAVVYISLGCFFMIRIRKNPVLVNEGLKLLRIKYRFK